jgi:Tfp pilus assembly protein PilX
MNAPNKLMRRDSGIALLTTLLLMLLMSSLLVGFVLLISSGQKLSGYNNDYSKAFYAAEAGMEKLTADIGTLFDQNYSPSGAQINALETTAPALAGINYVQYNGSSGYVISFPTDTNGNPLATTNVINSGTYEGMTALQTLYTLSVTARTTSGSEVKLQRTTQTVGIPMFQFGIFSATDLSFFPGPNFNFGGRTQTNGNLFLASGSSLTLSQPVTAYLNVIRTNLSNGFSTTTGSYGGSVNIFNGSGTRPLAYTEGSLVGTIGSATNPNWSNISLGSANYAGNLRDGATGAQTLNLGIVLLGNGTTQPVDMIRRPVVGESSSITALRYFAQASFRVLLSDNKNDITNLTPCLDTTVAPVDLSQLAQPASGWTAYGGFPAALFTKMTANNTAGYSTPPVPLAASAAALNAPGYNFADGYWLPGPTTAQPNYGTPTIKGFIKIEIQTNYSGTPCGTWKDVTLEVLSYGYAGRDLYQQTGLASGTQYGVNEPLNQLPTAPPLGVGIPASTCPDVHPNAIIRLERVRDNPSNYAPATGANPYLNCGITLSSGTTGTVTFYPTLPGDYWPNVLFDTREGELRDTDVAGSIGTVKYAQMVPLSGVISYIELDATNLAKYLTKTAPYGGGSGQSAYDSVNSPNDYSVYISDRRGNYTATSSFAGGWPPTSFSGTETGEYGFEDFVNSTTSQFGCPDSAVDAGEDLDGVGASLLFTYGQDATHASAAYTAGLNGGNGYYGAGSAAAVATALVGATTAKALAVHPNCTVTSPTTIWPFTYVIHANEARENPNFFFRRAVKIFDGANFANYLNTCPSGVICGLTIATENPVYIHGDFNCVSTCSGNTFSTVHAATSVAADSVTLLSNSWNDVNSFITPYDYPLGGNSIASAARNATTSYYRTAVMAGKGISFPQPGGYATNQDFGTDGGVHNFLRYLENWGGQTLNYEGSIISMYYNRQGTGVYKCCNTVYSPPTRGYNFDSEFLTPALLPPRTPLFRDVNTTGFTQLLLPSQ